MSYFASVPDGYFQESRMAEQQKALVAQFGRPNQFSLQTLMVVMAACAVVSGAAKLVIDATNRVAKP